MKEDDLCINLDPKALPDVQGDVARLPFCSAQFAEVYLERVPFSAFTGPRIEAVREIARVLQPGGRVIIETGILAPGAQLRGALQEVGFRNIRLTMKGLLRVSARLGG